MKELTHLLEIRKNFIRLVDSLTIDQLNKIPEGYSNNIIWNFAHVLATQQLLCYSKSDQKMNVSDDFISKYCKGSKPSGSVSEEDIATIKKMSIDLVTTMENDLKSDLFKNYTPYNTSFNLSINDLEDAIKFNNIHEGLHLGYAMAMKKLM